MDALRELLPIILSGSLGLLVVSIGLDADGEDLAYALAHPVALFRAVLSINVIVPVLAATVAILLPITPLSKTAIILMAVSPLPFPPGNQLRAGEQKSYVYGVYVVVLLLSIIIVPISVAIMEHVFGRAPNISVWAVVHTVFLSMLLPLALGTLIRSLWPRFSAKASTWVNRTGMVLVAIIFVPILLTSWPEIRALIGNGTVTAFCLVGVGALLAGHMLGGPSLGNRGALAMASAIRHPSLAMLIANANDADRKVSVAIILYVLVGLILGSVYRPWIKRRLRNEARGRILYGPATHSLR